MRPRAFPDMDDALLLAGLAACFTWCRLVQKNGGSGEDVKQGYPLLVAYGQEAKRRNII